MKIPVFYILIALIVTAIFLGIILPEVFAEKYKLDEDERFTGWLWYGVPGAYFHAQVWESSNPLEPCQGFRACTWVGVGGSIMILPEGEAHSYHGKGCTYQTHEYFHLMKYKENQVPLGCPDYVEYTK
jgi:hypothetical protein